MVSGALYFADRAMKTPDNYFRGFPALWNIAAFYLLLVRPPPLLALLFVAALVAATFVPFPFIHPVRVRRHRAFNIALLALWGVLAIAAVILDLDAARLDHRRLVRDRALCCLRGLFPNPAVSDACSTS